MTMEDKIIKLDQDIFNSLVFENGSINFELDGVYYLEVFYRLDIDAENLIDLAYKKRSELSSHKIIYKEYYSHKGDQLWFDDNASGFNKGVLEFCINESGENWIKISCSMKKECDIPKIDELVNAAENAHEVFEKVIKSFLI